MLVVAKLHTNQFESSSMPDDYMKILAENGMFSAALGIIGGAARLATGLSPNDSICAEVFRLAVIAMPFGWLAGGMAAEYGATEYMVNSAAVFSGLISHNLAKSAMQMAPSDMISILIGRKK